MISTAFALPTPYRATGAHLIYPRQLICGPACQRQQVSLTIAPAGVGKTSLLIAEAVHMAVGATLFEAPAKPLRVWLFNGEEPLDEVNRRIAAVCKHYNIEMTDLEKTLFVNSGRDATMELVTSNSSLDSEKDEQILILANAIKDKIDVIIADPFISTHSVSENDNTAIDKVSKSWAKIADVANCAVHLVHHSRKVSYGQVGVDSSRGASSLVAAVRYARTLNQMTDEEARSFGIGDKKSYVKINVGKENNSRSAGDRWFKLVSVDLENDLEINGIHHLSDKVGVVHVVDLLRKNDGLSAAELRAVLEATHSAFNAHNLQSGKWFGIELARILELDPLSDRRKLSAIIQSAINESVIEIFHEKKKGKQRTVPYVRLCTNEDEMKSGDNFDDIE